ncbi:MAG: TRAP transporter small permease [Bacillota bacterium]
MRTLKRIWALLLDVLEIYLPVVTFSIMLVAFALQIFTRYVLNNPLTWPYEVSVFAYLWTCLMGAAFARRLNAHVSFAIFYERLSPRSKIISRLVANVLVGAAFLVLFIPSYRYISFLKFQKSTVFRLPYNLIYAPYLLFLLLILGRTINDLYVDLYSLAGKGSACAGKETTT